MTKVPFTVSVPPSIVIGPAITQFSFALIVTSELIVAGFLNTPDRLESTCPVMPLASPFAEIGTPSAPKDPDPVLFIALLS